MRSLQENYAALKENKLFDATNKQTNEVLKTTIFMWKLHVKGLFEKEVRKVFVLRRNEQL